MRYIIRGEKITVTDSMKSYLEEKISKLERFLVNSENVEVKAALKVKGVANIVEVTINMPHLILRAEEHHSDMYAAIDLVVDKLERQIRKNKNKLKNKHKEEKIINFDSFDFEDEEENLNIVKRKTVFLKPMDEEEAILQMELLGHNFFVFKNIETESICVLYKRKDEDYGIIDTK